MLGFITKVFLSTGGPHNLRTIYMYLQIRLFAVQECVPNLKIHGLSNAYLRIFDGIGHKIRQKLVNLSQTVLPRYFRFHNTRLFARTYLPRITKATCIALSPFFLTR